MRQCTIWIMAAVICMGATVSMAGEPTGSAVATVHAAPPIRPAGLTDVQFQALRVIETMPEHHNLVNTNASYSAREKNLQFTRFSDDVWTVAYQVGWPGAYLAVLLCAL